MNQPGQESLQANSRVDSCCKRQACYSTRRNFSLKMLSMFARIVTNHIEPFVNEIRDDTVRELLAGEVQTLRKIIKGIDDLIRTV